MLSRNLKEINGKLPIHDPVSDIYQRVQDKLCELNWEDFEDLMAAVIGEIGFSDVQRLTRGSQHGRDIIATWYSRFHLGRSVKFRFQCKHSKKSTQLVKRDVGASIADFLIQKSDEILIVVTNTILSNDLLEFFDKIESNRVYVISGFQTVRFFGTSPKLFEAYLGLPQDYPEAFRHLFDFRKWIEAICCNASDYDLFFELYRFWTEPYTWFFRRNQAGELERLWTTAGGDFRFTCFNKTHQIQDLSGLTLRLLEREGLPDFGVINTTPKGGHNLHRLRVELSCDLGDWPIPPEREFLLTSGRAFSCMIEFRGVDPGIYYFQLVDMGTGGSVGLRESEVHRIVHVPEPPPENILHVYESWPESLLLIEELFRLSDSEREKMLGHGGSNLLLFRNEQGDIEVKYQHRDDHQLYVVPDMPGYKIEHPLSSFLWGGNFKSHAEPHHLDQWHDWCEEWLDESEPRGPIKRAYRLLQHNKERYLVHDSLCKAHERTPSHSKINVYLFFAYHELGYKGFAKFHLKIALITNPSNPVIAALHFLMSNDESPEVDLSDYEANLSALGIQGFRRLVGCGKIPNSYEHAFDIAFPEEPDLRDIWSDQKW